LTRHVLTIENKGSSALDLAPTDRGNNFYWYLQNYDKTAVSSNTSSCASMTADDHWAVVAGLSGTTIAGMAWQAHDGTAFTSLGEDCTDQDFSAHITKASLAAGEKVNYMTLIATAEPAGPSTGEMDTAFAAALAQMSVFDSLNDTFCRDLVDGTVIEGWGTCGAPAPNSALPDTGANTAVMGSSIAIGSSLLIAGALALIVVRRRQARS
jgi:LPXTG-motif cell wall-anchored protein